MRSTSRSTFPSGSVDCEARGIEDYGRLTPALHQRFRELMFHSAAREGLLCPIYCLMPDHLHLVWMGLRLDTDQLNRMAFLRTHLEPELSPARFQPQAQDEVLRDERRKRNAFARVCFYIAANPCGLNYQPNRKNGASPAVWFQAIRS